MKLGISSENLQDAILTKAFDLMKNMRGSQGAGNANPKLGVKLPPQPR
jgi:hypothetical protein